MAGGNWHASTRGLREEFRTRLDLVRLRALHRRSPLLHSLVALRQVLLTVASVYLVVRFGDRPWIWVPAAVLLGFLVFSFTVLLHEVVHGTVFRRPRPRAEAALAWLYALPGGLAPSQFRRWHLDHHAELGTATGDPKRHHLTPRVVRRWFKALYLTPALFPIYFRAAAREAATYAPALRARLRRERVGVVAFHLGLAGTALWGGGPALLAKAYLLPVLFVFPVAFTINRLGQHYDIDPADAAAWGTVIRPNAFWDFLFLWSGYHVEHHWFPRVPFYNLPALHRELAAVFARHPMRVRGYGGLLFDWFVRNRVPHTRWDANAGR